MLPKQQIEQVIESQKQRIEALDTGLPRHFEVHTTQLTTHAFIVSGMLHSK